MDKVREIALKCLYKIEQNNAYSNIVLSKAIKENKNTIDDRDIGLISEIVYGVTTWRLTLDEIIMLHSKIRIKKISPWIKNILRMGAYQIIFLDKIPKSASVNESVNLAKIYGNKGSQGFVNAILRKIEKNDLDKLYNLADKVKKISVTTSMPIWIVEALLKQYTEQEAKEICINSNVRPQTTIRINPLKTSNLELQNKLKERNIEYEATEFENFLILKKQKNIEELDLFKEGYFTVQDLSAGMVANVLSPRSGENVLDCCSAPGGKTTHIAELMKNSGKIDAWDIHEHRTNLVKKAYNRLGINIINTYENDATKFNPQLVEKYDKILLDVPCLGLGVIKRKPDIKWQRKPEDIKKISKLQYDILENCSKYLKTGGELVYSTCSILEDENEKNIETFLKNNPNFTFADYTKIPYYNIIQKFITKNRYINIHTSKNYDGFFICKLKKL